MSTRKQKKSICLTDCAKALRYEMRIKMLKKSLAALKENRLGLLNNLAGECLVPTHETWPTLHTALISAVEAEVRFMTTAIEALGIQPEYRVSRPEIAHEC